jgi:hypothetical protein
VQLGADQIGRETQLRQQVMTVRGRMPRDAIGADGAAHAAALGLLATVTNVILAAADIPGGRGRNRVRQAR